MKTKTYDKFFQYIVILLLLFSQRTLAANVFATCHISQSVLSWGEPCSITLAVYTRTWFTEGVSFPEMTKQNGVLLKSGRSHTFTEIIGGERYSVVEQAYVYYPFETGEQILRFEELTVKSPLPNEYQGTKHVLSIPPKKIEIHIPYNQTTPTTTARHLKVKQNFELSDTLRVGDVITRTLHFSASGVPAAFIMLPQVVDTMKQIRITREQPEYATDFHYGHVSGSAVQRILYQPVDSGIFVLPPIIVDYWSLKSKRMEKIILEGKNVCILPPLGGFPTVKTTITKKTDYSNVALLCIVIICICIIACFLSLYIYRLVRKIRCSSIWKILTASDYPQLYDSLYVYARTLHFDSFYELAKIYSELQHCYEGLQLRLFKDEYSNCPNIVRIKCSLLVILFYSRYLPLKRKCCFRIKQ